MSEYNTLPIEIWEHIGKENKVPYYLLRNILPVKRYIIELIDCDEDTLVYIYNSQEHMREKILDTIVERDIISALERIEYQRDKLILKALEYGAEKILYKFKDNYDVYIRVHKISFDTYSLLHSWVRQEIMNVDALVRICIALDWPHDLLTFIPLCEWRDYNILKLIDEACSKNIITYMFDNADNQRYLIDHIYAQGIELANVIHLLEVHQTEISTS